MNLRQRLLCLCFLLLTLPAVWWLSRDLETKLSPDDLLPSDTLLLLHWNNFSHFAGQVADSPLARQVLRRDFPDTLKRLGVQEDQVQQFSRRLALLRSVQSLPLAPQLLDSQAMLALIPSRSAQDSLEDALRASLIFIVQDSAADLESFLPDSGGTGVSQEVYLGVTIRKHRLPEGDQIHVCTVRGLTLLAFAPEPLARCIEQSVTRMLGGTQAAHGGKNWLARYRLLPEQTGEFFCYLNLEGLRTQPVWGAALAPLWQGLRPRQAIVAHCVQGREHGFRLALRFEPRVLNRWMAAHALAPPAQPPVAASQDTATLLHFWTNWFTPAVAASAGQAIRSTELGAPLLAAAGKFLENFSFTKETFYRIFEPELGLVVRGERNQNGQLKPLFSLYLCRKAPSGRYRDVSVRAMLEQRFKNFPRRTVRLENGTEATAIGMAGGVVQPALADIGRHFVLADNLYMLQTMENRFRLGGEDRNFLQTQTKRKKPTEASVFLHLNSRQVADSSSWLLRYLADAKNERDVAILTEQQKLFVQQVALPFMATLGSAGTSRFVLTVADGEAQGTLMCTLEP